MYMRMYVHSYRMSLRPHLHTHRLQIPVVGQIPLIATRNSNSSCLVSGWFKGSVDQLVQAVMCLTKTQKENSLKLQYNMYVYSRLYHTYVRTYRHTCTYTHKYHTHTYVRT